MNSNINWSNLSSVLPFLSQANNNLNVLTHPAYFTTRSNIKNKQKLYDNLGLLCVGNKEVAPPDEIDKAHIFEKLDKPADVPDELKNGSTHLYDEYSFSNGRTYIVDVDEPFMREDFLNALRDVTKNPILYLNSSKYNPEKSLDACEEEEERKMSFLHLLDPTNLLQQCRQHGLVM